MNILVCIKQVPNTDKIKIDKEKNTLIREGVESIINPFDTYAIEFANRIKDENSDTKITVITMGPKQATKALQSAYALGVDFAYLITDRKFGGSDTLATSYILSKSIKYIEKEREVFDLILCGKQAIDGDTAQVGPELAEHLNYPQVTYVRELKVKDDYFIVKKETDEGYQILEVPKKSLMTITKPSFEPRFPSLSMKMKAKKKEIFTIDINSLSNIDQSKIGLKGSPTKVKKTYVNKIEKENHEITGSSKEIAKQIYKIIEK
ncbi:MAG: electron transfer flavoprotein subunit beta/FixA family protein [Pleomorphochaeta sp.]